MISTARRKVCMHVCCPLTLPPETEKFETFAVICTGLMSMLTRKKKKTVFYNQGSNQSKFIDTHSPHLYPSLSPCLPSLPLSLPDMLAVGDEVVTYEDVVRMAPNPQWKRPIVLVGTHMYNTVIQWNPS